MEECHEERDDDVNRTDTWGKEKWCDKGTVDIVKNIEHADYFVAKR